VRNAARLREAFGCIMTPIHELLSRIRWDKEFGQGCFEIGYYDRMARTIQRVALREIVFPPEERRLFETVDECGRFQRIPFHRVREVYRDGQLVWQRPKATSLM
jgi:uncharacterized protein (UPF0248 family)